MVALQEFIPDEVADRIAGEMLTEFARIAKLAPGVSVPRCIAGGKRIWTVVQFPTPAPKPTTTSNMVKLFGTPWPHAAVPQHLAWASVWEAVFPLIK